MKSTLRNYEALYIIDATLGDEQIDAVIAKYSAVVKDQGGEVQAAGKWDKRRLAYEVKGRREGGYILMYFSGEPAVSEELDRVFKISDDVLRHLITRIEPQRIETLRIEQPQPAVETVAEAAVEEPKEATAEEVVAEEPAAEETTAPEEPAEVQEEALVDPAPEEVQLEGEPPSEAEAEETQAEESTEGKVME